MNSPLTCHFLIGSPGSGKSTLAAQMIQSISSSQIISTDQIRAQLYGDAATQGNWAEIESVVLTEIKEAITKKIPSFMTLQMPNEFGGWDFFKK